MTRSFKELTMIDVHVSAENLGNVPGGQGPDTVGWETVFGGMNLLKVVEFQ